MTPARVLVTGLNGLIGWHLFQFFRERYETFGTFREQHPSLTGESFFRVDIDNETSLAEFIRRIQPDYLVHAWAMCDLDLCEQMPWMAEKMNVEGTRKVLAAARESKALKKIIYLSTDHVFDGEAGSYDENHAPKPKHVYGRTKVEAEELVKSSKLPYLIIRPGLVIGKSLQGNKGPRDFLFHRIRKEKFTHYFTDEWRTPIEGPRLAAGVDVLMMSRAEGIFHLAGKEITNRYDLACALAAGEGLPVQYVRPRLRAEDKWGHIRPKNLSLKSVRESFGLDVEIEAVNC